MIAKSNGENRDWTLALLLTSAGLLSAFITMCVRYPFGHYAVSRSKLLDFGQIFLPGAVFGAIVAGCFSLRRYSRGLWKAIAIFVAFSVSYFVSFLVAVATELHSPFLENKARGEISGQALFVGGLTGAFCTLCAVSLLLNSDLTLKRRVFKVLYWTPVGAFLAILGWALGPSLGIAFWQLVHSLNFTAPDETIRNAAGETSHTYSLWAVWQAGMGCALGLIVSGKGQATKEHSAESSKIIKLMDK